VRRIVLALALVVGLVVGFAPAHADRQSPDGGCLWLTCGNGIDQVCALTPWQPCTDPAAAQAFLQWAADNPTYMPAWTNSYVLGFTAIAVQKFYDTLDFVENRPVCPVEPSSCQTVGDTIDAEVAYALDQTQLTLQPLVDLVFGPDDSGTTDGFWGDLWHGVKACFTGGVVGGIAGGASTGTAAGAGVGAIAGCIEGVFNTVFH
jgi:hypothetical protein